jgi:biotin carboxyl carrier protein
VKRTIRFQLDGVTYQVEVERNGDRLTVSREGERYTVSLLEAAKPGETLSVGAAGVGAVAQPAVAQPAAPAEQATAAAPAAPAPRTMEAAKPGQAGAGLMRAPMTGVIKEVKVAAGSRVARGEVVLVMEAMKMDVEVSAPASGVVAEVNVSAGQKVESQAPLLLIQG